MGVAERRQREKKERRSSILSAAERVFLQKGIASATMDDIAQQAELSKGTLYLYFRNKDELYLHIALGALDDLDQHFIAAKRQVEGQTGFEHLEALLKAYIAFARAHRDRFRVAMSWVSAEYSMDAHAADFEKYRESVQRVMSYGVDAIAMGQADGTIRTDVEAERLAFQVWGSTVGLLLLQANEREVEKRIPIRIDFDAVLAAHVDLVLQSLRGDAPVSSRRPSQRPGRDASEEDT